VQRQYSGTAGKVENCQVATLLTYATRRGHVFLDRRLYLPEEWARDPQRRARAAVPPDVPFQTKPQQAVAMLAHAWAQGVPMRWVTGDEVYGDAPYLRAAIERAGCGYVLAVSSTTPVWPVPVAGMAPERVAEVAPLTTVAAVVAGWPAERWQRLTVAAGEKGPRTYDWACGRVIDRREGQPGRAVWLLARRSLSDPGELAYYLGHGPEDPPLATLARVAATRYTVEQCIEEAKGEAGLDQYEVRRWHSWHRHITLALMAHTWLAAVRAAAAEKGGPPRS
ncbi:MAG TPA: IS701 family transposase, partial [Chloroflexota bacterium]|nr:IS701 family transposase [Chloroflexota bacterium]